MRSLVLFLYPILHELKQKKLLETKNSNVSGKIRKFYKTTAEGREILKRLKKFLKELSKEVL